MNPLSVWNFCPKCGEKSFENYESRAKRCSRCGHVFFLNSATAVAVFILNSKNELLVARRSIEPAKGTLDLVGGFLEFEESAEEGVVRETKEETGLTLDKNKLTYLFSLPNVYPFSEIEIHTIDLFFKYQIQSEDIVLNPQDDICELQFVPINQIDYKEFGLKSVQNAILQFQKKF